MDIVTGLEAKQPTLIITKPSSKPKKLFEGTKPIDVIGSVANIKYRFDFYNYFTFIDSEL